MKKRILTKEQAESGDKIEEMGELEEFPKVFIGEVHTSSSSWMLQTTFPVNRAQFLKICRQSQAYR